MDTHLHQAVPLGLILSGHSHPPVVYFARVPGGIKIGTSTKLGARMRSMYVPLTAVLALVPGGKDVEDTYHDLFRDFQVTDAVGREVFDIEHLLGRFLGHAAHPMTPLPDPLQPDKPELILPFLTGRPGGASAPEIGKLIGRSGETARRHLTALARAGLVELQGAGRGARWHAIPSEERTL